MNPRRANAKDQSTPPEVESISPETGGEEDESAESAPVEGQGAPGVPLEIDAAAVARLTEEVAELRDRHLRLAAEYENFRKRTARERTETWVRAQADVVGNILDSLDDLGRVLDLDLKHATADDVLKGVALVERKLIRELQSAGLERIGNPGEPFDPNHHEAIGSLPAKTPEEDHTVGAVLQVGYRYGGALLRPAKVQVRLWRDSAEQPEGQ